MKIVNKEQFAIMPIGTVFCLFKPSVLDGNIHVKSDFRIYDDKPTFNGVIPLCPYFDIQENEDFYKDKPDEDYSYYTECFSTDTTLYDYNDSQLFAVFSKTEIRRMIDVLTYALSDCEGKCITDEDCYIVN